MMGIVSDEELEKELNNINSIPIIPRIERIKQEHGRNENDVNVPESLRKIIGETGAIDGRQEALALANMFGISDSSASAYANGATSTTTYDRKDIKILTQINSRKERISKKASRVANKALNNITDDKLENLDAHQLSSIARNMSAIVKDMEPEIAPEDNDTQKNKPQFVFYAPRVVQENHYETIVAKE